ncbi:hypothetical protein EJ03DRAFT_163812 [Teratosphaeria nubilosa]|uniref:Uncharacterized protein n=1 Tax=Teratosphaeria nubilosa TaxID=161662 RepID=A0A6G1L2E9_9PEZI|nr:hypothetical protein EJ03DRAFT_163812 [Teratosphaeria nubilosa]
MRSGKFLKHGTVTIWTTKSRGTMQKDDFPDLPDSLGIGSCFCFDRTDWSPCGWGDLAGPQVECPKIEGNHRNFMVPLDVGLHFRDGYADVSEADVLQADVLVSYLDNAIAKVLG